MRSNAIIAALVLALAAAPIVAQEASDNAGQNAAQQPPVQAGSTSAQAQAVPAAAAEPDPGEEVICRRDRATGSLTRVNRVCKTRNEWNGVHDATRDNLNDMQRNASGGSQCISLGNC